MINSLNLILKDFSKNDNLIKILKKHDGDFDFYCTCGNQYCHHLDYIIHTISNDINNKIYERCYQIVGFDNIEYIARVIAAPADGPSFGVAPSGV